MRIPLHVMTLALDAMPWLAYTFAELSRLHEIPWRWTIVHGAAMNTRDTRWMQPQKPRLSTDGTTEFLHSLSFHPRIRIIEQPSWDGKVTMCNAALATFNERGVLMQIDADELWQVDQLRRIVETFEDDPAVMLARFDCRYFIAPNVVTTDRGKPSEWQRAWRFSPGIRFDSHEPPVLQGNHGKNLTREDTAAMGLIFQHHAYSLSKHVEQKERLYGPKFHGLKSGWDKLRANTDWPVADVGRFLPLAFRGTPVDKIF